MYDVAIIGAGVVGAFIARELSKYDVKICIIEKEADVAMGTSKANSAIIHAGYDPIPGTFKAELSVLGNLMMDEVSRELDVPFERIGSLVLAFSEQERATLEELLHRGKVNGVGCLSIIDSEKLRQIEPGVSEKALAALYAPTAGIICPYELTIAAFENAIDNGTEIKLEHKVENITCKQNSFLIQTDKEEIECSYIINAAGLFADEISRMIGDTNFSIGPRKGEYILLDKSQGSLINSVVFQTPTNKGKGILVTRTVDGNLLIGPNARDISDKEDMSTTEDGLEEIVNGAFKSVPSINTRETITAFAGLRAKPSGEDFIIKPSVCNKRFINVAGIDSPGLTASPAIGKYTAELLGQCGLVLNRKSSFNPVRKRVIRFRDLKNDELQAIIKINPLYGKIVCRCEKVSEAEIIDCIKKCPGARSLDAVKRRTRAGMGRCQGGFCTSRVVEILSKELGLPYEEVTKMGGKSNLLAGRTK